jgi:hypothetical protein
MISDFPPMTVARLVAARAFLKSAAPRLAGPYAAIVREARALGWPLNYRRDLYRWDRRAIMHMPEGRRFAWCVRPSGTHLVIPAAKGEGLPSTLCRTIATCFESEASAWFWYDGKGSRMGLHWIGSGAAGAEVAGRRADEEWHRVCEIRRRGNAA